MGNPFLSVEASHSAESRKLPATCFFPQSAHPAIALRPSVPASLPLSLLLPAPFAASLHFPCTTAQRCGQPSIQKVSSHIVFELGLASAAWLHAAQKKASK